jgi:hypothetical protein
MSLEAGKQARSSGGSGGGGPSGLGMHGRFHRPGGRPGDSVCGETRTGDPGDLSAGLCLRRRHLHARRHGSDPRRAETTTPLAPRRTLGPLSGEPRSPHHNSVRHRRAPGARTCRTSHRKPRDSRRHCNSRHHRLPALASAQGHLDEPALLPRAVRCPRNPSRSQGDPRLWGITTARPHGGATGPDHQQLLGVPNVVRCGLGQASRMLCLAG